jgi:hypothetical protein
MHGHMTDERRLASMFFLSKGTSQAHTVVSEGMVVCKHVINS